MWVTSRPGTHLAVFTAQPVCAHSVWLQGTRGGVAAETRTFLERGRGFVGRGHTERPVFESKYCALKDSKGRKNQTARLLS